MTIQHTLPLYKLDPNLFTGPIRMTSGVGRTGDVVVDTYYNEFARWLYLSTPGNVSYIKWDGTTQILNNLIAGVFHPILSICINSSGTTATGMVWGS